MSKPQEYWNDRALERLTLIERYSSQYFDQIAKLYTNAKFQIYADIERMLAKYIKDAGLGIEQARELLTVRESQDFLDGLRKQLATVEDPRIRRQLLNQLNAPAYRARISRLQAVEASIDTNIKMIAPQESAILKDSLISTADISYYRTLYDYQRGTGLGFSFNGLSEEVVQRALEENWSGKDFSKRIWTNTDIVAARTKDIVQQNVMTGRSWRRCQQDLTGYVDTKNAGAEYAAERLLRTETNHIHNEITAEAHKEMGVKKYHFLAVLDAVTSQICQKHDGNIDPDTKEEYSYENKKVGVNFPPLHPFCRSVINARLDPDIEARLVRRAKNPVTGEISSIPYNTTYPEWVASLSPEQQNQFKLNKKIEANESADKKQYEKYKVLLKEDMPSSFKKFQDLKYRDSERWKYTQLDYKRRNHLVQNPVSALPNAAHATAANEKFSGYIFNPNSVDGGAKGVAFDSRLGYNENNWSELQKQILARAKQYPVLARRTDQYGTRYEQSIIIYGLKNKPANVLVGWNVAGSETKMTTAMITEVK